MLIASRRAGGESGSCPACRVVGRRLARLSCDGHQARYVIVRVRVALNTSSGRAARSRVPWGVKQPVAPRPPPRAISSDTPPGPLTPGRLVFRMSKLGPLRAHYTGGIVHRGTTPRALKYNPNVMAREPCAALLSWRARRSSRYTMRCTLRCASRGARGVFSIRRAVRRFRFVALHTQMEREKLSRFFARARTQVSAGRRLTHTLTHTTD